MEQAKNKNTENTMLAYESTTGLTLKRYHRTEQGQEHGVTTLDNETPDGPHFEARPSKRPKINGSTREEEQLQAQHELEEQGPREQG